MENVISTHTLPVICTRGVILFPDSEKTIDVGRKKSLDAIKVSQQDFNSRIILVSQMNPEIFDPKDYELYTFGTVCVIKNVKRNSDGSSRVTLACENRVKVEQFKMFPSTCVYADVTLKFSSYGDKDQEAALIRVLTKTIEGLGKTNNPSVLSKIDQRLSKGISASQLSDFLAQNIVASLEKRQELLEILDVNERLLRVIEIIEEEKNISSIENEITEKVKSRLEENQREYILREKMRAIREELGDVADAEADDEKIRRQLNENPYPEFVKARVLEELKRYNMMPSASAEASVIRSYIDVLLKTPWYQQTTDNDDLNNVEKILNDDHYGLDKIKERIMEYLAVKKLTSSLKAPILCFSGPPGTGKTSLAMSIARALERKFVKVSLGGTDDEAEIRGHRRTYVGAMPGRIIQGMQKAGVVNPVFLLDEIDKLGKGYKGDPSNALLEVLDPEQNKIFSDNYMEEPYDLSKVLFIATANYLEDIPAPLKDRLEIIELSSYTEVEKLQIAKRHLIGLNAEQNGLKKSKISFTDDALLHIIRYYTREAGVRQLSRLIGTICRKVAVYLVKNNIETKQSVTIKKVKEYLGKEKFDYTKKDKNNQVGVTTGLAYTQYGGDILPIEVVTFKGKGLLHLTGNLGEIMKESANIALGFIKSHADKLNINPEVLEKVDIHIHAPEGAVPKDGPSAGVTITTSLVSCLTNKPVRNDVAMTGEVTLRGNVLPIGGLKEKSIAAHRSGIKTIYIPFENQKDIDDIPESVRGDMQIIPVKHVFEILENVLVEG